MTSWPQLPLLMVVPRDADAHDLPVSWDGRAVEWSAWKPVPHTSIEYHRPKECCDSCGSFARRAMAHGTVQPLPDETFESTRTKRTKSGRDYEIACDVPAWPVMTLLAYRCADCRNDEVMDMGTGTLWTLDASDYGPNGSNDTPSL